MSERQSSTLLRVLLSLSAALLLVVSSAALSGCGGDGVREAPEGEPPAPTEEEKEVLKADPSSK